MKKKSIMAVSIMFLVLIGLLTISQVNIYAKNKMPTLSKKMITMKEGNKKTIKLKNVSKKVKWKIIEGKKYAKITKKTGKHKNTIKVKAKRAGKVVIRAKYGKKTYKVKITIKKKKTERITDPNNVQIDPVESKPTVHYATITFETFKGKKIDSIQIEIGKPYGDLPIAEWENYCFLGWSTEYYGKPIEKTDICTGNVTLYAILYYLGGSIPTPGEEYIQSPRENLMTSFRKNF